MASKRNFTRKPFVPRVPCWCSGKAKIAYATRDDALAARNKHGVVRLRVYQCPHSHAWHLTSQV